MTFCAGALWERECGAELGGQGRDGVGIGGRGEEGSLEFAGDHGGLGVAEHSHGAGELVGGGGGFHAEVVLEVPAMCGGGGAVEELEASEDDGEVAHPEGIETGGYPCGCRGGGSAGVGFVWHGDCRA